MKLPRGSYLIIMLLVSTDAKEPGKEHNLVKPFCAEVDGNSATNPGIYEYDDDEEFEWVRTIMFYQFQGRNQGCSQRLARLENPPPQKKIFLVHSKQISVVSKSDKQNPKNKTKQNRKTKQKQKQNKTKKQRKTKKKQTNKQTNKIKSSAHFHTFPPSILSFSSPLLQISLLISFQLSIFPLALPLFSLSSSFPSSFPFSSFPPSFHNFPQTFQGWATRLPLPP